MVTGGGVNWIDLDTRRPCVAVSSRDVLGVDLWPTHVVPLTSNLDRAGLAGNVLLDAAVTGLPNDSVAVPCGLEVVDRPWLGDGVGEVCRSANEVLTAGLQQNTDRTGTVIKHAPANAAADLSN